MISSSRYKNGKAELEREVERFGDPRKVLDIWKVSLIMEVK